MSIDGAPWLVKFSEGEDLDLQVIEHATMTLAARCGIAVALTKAYPLPGGHAVAVKRFDWVRSGALSLHAPPRASCAFGHAERW